MNFSKIFILRPVMTILVMISIVVFGIIAYNTLPVSDLPNVDYPTIQVEVDNPGSNPETMASTCATPLEREFMTIDGINSITSNSVTGKTTLICQFSLSKDIDSASIDVTAAINRAEPNLPKNLPYNPTYKKVNPSQTPILYLALTSDTMGQNKLYTYGDTYIGQRISMIEGVSQVETYGAPYAARIQVDPEKIANMGIGIDEIAEAIKRGNVELATGTLYGENREFTIDVDGQLENAAGYENLVIKTENGALIKISQIGRALDSLQNDKYFLNYRSRQESKKTLVIAVQREPGKNTVKIINAINKLLPTLEKELPSSVKIHKVFDKKESIEEGVSDVKLTLIIAFFLVVFVIFLVLGKIFDTVAPAIALPIIIIGTFAIMKILGFSIDILSLSALTLSIGFLVDDAIVVLENNARHVEMGKEPKIASLDGSKEISMTIVSMSLCLISVFIPILFLAGVVGRLFREFAMVIIIAVFISGFISLTLTPLLCSKFLKKRKKTIIETFCNRINDFILNIYKKSLDFVFRHKISTIFVGLFCILGSIFLFIYIPKDFLPNDDIGFIQGFSQAKDGTSPFEMARYQQEVGEMIIKDPGVDFLVSVASTETDNEGMMFIKLKPYNKRQPCNKIIQRLMPKLSTIVGINSYLSEIPLINLQIGTDYKALYQFTLSSLDQKILNKYSDIFFQKMQQVPIFTQVSSDLQINQPTLSMKIKRDKASNFNITASKIENAFSFAYSGGKISTINTPINQYDVIIETLPKFYRDKEALEKLYIRSDNNYLVPISELVSIKKVTTPLSVNHINGLPATTLSFNLKNTSLSESMQKLNELSQEILPKEIFAKPSGTIDVFKESFKNLNFLFIITIFLIYVILGILYENFIHPITVMSTLFPATLGSLLALFLFHKTLSLYSFIGLIMVIGIVMKNGIMMVDFANKIRREQKKDAKESILNACYIRFRPIVMTSIAAFVGSLPIALGIGGSNAKTRIPLGLAVAGGLLVSQVITLFLTPVVYYYMEKLQRRRG